MTAEESILWQQLRKNHLNGYHFRRQQVIEGFVVDFYCHAIGLIVELDGESHLSTVEYDRVRDTFLSSLGLRVLRFANAEVNENLTAVLSIIASAVSHSQARSNEG